MALSIRNARAERLAREIAAISGENITQVIIHTLENQIERLSGRRIYPDTVREILNISERCRSLPDIDKKTPDVQHIPAVKIFVRLDLDENS